MTELRIAPGLKLDPDDIGGGTLALLAKKGAGKTYAMRVLAEELWKAKVPFVILDPMDVCWGLRSSADGESEGIPVAVFGGPHADAPLERTGGTLIADLVVEEGLSMILSLKHFGTRAAEKQFAMDFLERLYRRNSELVHVMMDEADLFAPQKPKQGEQQLLGVTENIVRRGRNNGIGITLATQRPAVLNKDVLNQVDGLIIGQMTGPTDRHAIDGWVGHHGEEGGLGSEVEGTLPELHKGQMWIWVPELGVLKQVQIRKARTFDSSPTRKRGAREREPKSFADVDMGAIEAKMADTIERAKAEDPRELRKRIRGLEKELRERPAETKEVEVEKVVEVPVLANGVVERLQEAVRSVLDAAEGIQGELARVATPPRPRGERREGVVRPAAKVSRPATPPASAAPRAADKNAIASESGDVRLKAGARRMLSSLAMLHPEPLSRVQVATLSDISPKSGTFSDYLSSIKRAGLVVEEHGKVELTTAGQGEMGGELGAGAPSPAELQAMWGRKLKAGARRMLDALMEVHPDGLSREELADRSEIARSSGTFSDYLSSLKRNALAEEHSGVVYAGEALFLGAPA